MASILPVICREYKVSFFILYPPSHITKADEAKLLHEMCFSKKGGPRLAIIYEHC